MGAVESPVVVFVVVVEVEADSMSLSSLAARIEG
jgi:hypothetical protein